MLIDSQTNELVDCYFREVNRGEIEQNEYNPIGGWEFDWLDPLVKGFEIYGLVSEEYPEDIQGLIAIKPIYDPA